MSVAPPPGENTPVAGPVNPRTGEPRRPWVAWAALFAYFGASGWVVAALLVGMWNSVRDFPSSAWLQGAIPTPYGDPWRLLLASIVWLIAITIATVAIIVGYSTWSGHAWTRWAGVIAVGVGLLSFLGNAWAPWCLVGLAVGAGLAWLPSMRAFNAAWTAHRHPPRPVARAYQPVAYGPAPRYR